MLTVIMCIIFIHSAEAQFWKKQQSSLLPEEQAFQVNAEIVDGQLQINWSIAEDYYMYRDSFKIEEVNSGLLIEITSFPKGEIEDDPEFGMVEVYFYNALLSADTSSLNSSTINLVLHGQGCNKPVGVCYPPMQRAVTLQLDDSITTASPETTATTPSESTKSFFGYILTAFGAGLLLSLTPCVLPMIPILAGIIAGQKNPSRKKSGWLAICYVAGTIVTYLIAGWIAGATGAQLQAYFQNPWVIGFICLLLVLLAASLFGWYKIQMPSSIQSKFSNSNVSSKSASITSFSLGLISALVVGACVSPILIIALGAAITQGDPILGASIMGAMALGMGVLLILFGFGAGWLLPKTGPWMTQIQVIFGFMVLGVAIYLLDTLALFPTLYLWAILLLYAGFYCWQLATDNSKPMIVSSIKVCSTIAIIWGAMALVGAVTNGSNILNPLQHLTTDSSDSKSFKSSLPFKVTTTLAGTEQQLSIAQQRGKPVMIDFYADWCLDCKRMHRTTFRNKDVIEALSDWMLIEVDVTETSKQSEEVKRHFNVFGPPATLFIDSSGKEYDELRQYGYLKSDDFLNILSQIK